MDGGAEFAAGEAESRRRRRCWLARDFAGAISLVGGGVGCCRNA